MHADRHTSRRVYTIFWTLTQYSLTKLSRFVGRFPTPLNRYAPPSSIFRGEVNAYSGLFRFRDYSYVPSEEWKSQ